MLHFCNNSPAAHMLVRQPACPDSQIGSIDRMHDGLTVRRPAFLLVGPLAAIVPPLTLGRASGPSFLDRLDRYGVQGRGSRWRASMAPCHCRERGIPFAPQAAARRWVSTFAGMTLWVGATPASVPRNPTRSGIALILFQKQRPPIPPRLSRLPACRARGYRNRGRAGRRSGARRAAGRPRNFRFWSASPRSCRGAG